MELPPAATAWSIPTLSTPTWRLKTTPPPPPSPATPSPSSSARGASARARGSGGRGGSGSKGIGVGNSGSGSGSGSGGGGSGGGGGVLPPLPSVAGRYARVTRGAADALTPAAVDLLRATSREASLPLHEHLLAAYVVFFASGANVGRPDGDSDGDGDGEHGGSSGGVGGAIDNGGGGDSGRGDPLAATLATTLSSAASAAEGVDAAARVLAKSVSLGRRTAVMRSVATVGGALEAACAAGGGEAAVASAKLRVLDDLGGDDRDATAAVWAWEAVKGRL